MVDRGRSCQDRRPSQARPRSAGRWCPTGPAEKLQRLDFCVLFRCRALVHDAVMATLAQKIQCEKDTRLMLRQQDVPQPDWVEYGHTCIRLFWDASKLVLIVDIDEPPEGIEVVGEYLDDLDGDDADEAADGLDSDDSDEDEDFDYGDAVEELKRLDSDGEHEVRKMD